MLKWENRGDDAVIKIGYYGRNAYISCRSNCRVYKDGTKQYMIYFSIPCADSKEIITITKIRGMLDDAKAAAEKWLREFFEGLKEVEEDLYADAPVAKFIKERKEEAIALGATLILDEDDLIDMEHKDPIWYGGYIAELKYKGYRVSIKVHGEVNLAVYAHGDGYDGVDDILLGYRDKNGQGAYKNEDAMAILKNDAVLKEMENDGRLVWENNNWIEFFIYDKNGENVTDEACGAFSNISDGDVFDSICDLKYYTDLIDKHIKKNAK